MTHDKMKIAALSISKKNISMISKTVSYCEENQIDELIILLFGEIYGENSIVEKDGLMKLANALPKKTKVKIHLVREGLGYTLSPKDYHEIFDYTDYSVETSYSCRYNNYGLNFQSNNLEDCMWDDQSFMKLQKQASSKTEIKISAVYKPAEDDCNYMSSWGKGAWKLSDNMESTLIYLDDGDGIEFHDQYVYRLFDRTKLKDYGFYQQAD